MKTTIRFTRSLAAVASLPLLVGLGVWVATGANVGWTRTSAVVMHHDEVTGIDYPVHQPAFVAGIEIVAIGVVAAITIAAVGLLSRKLIPRRA